MLLKSFKNICQDFIFRMSHWSLSYPAIGIVTCWPLPVIIAQDFSSDEMIAVWLLEVMTDDAGAGDECMTHSWPYCNSERTLYCLSIADTYLSDEHLSDNGLAEVVPAESKNVGPMPPHSSLTLYLLLTCCVWKLIGEWKAAFALQLMAPNNIHHYPASPYYLLHHLYLSAIVFIV